MSETLLRRVRQIASASLLLRSRSCGGGLPVAYDDGPKVVSSIIFCGASRA